MNESNSLNSVNERPTLSHSQFIEVIKFIKTKSMGLMFNSIIKNLNLENEDEENQVIDNLDEYIKMNLNDENRIVLSFVKNISYKKLFFFIIKYIPNKNIKSYNFDEDKNKYKIIINFDDNLEELDFQNIFLDDCKISISMRNLYREYVLLRYYYFTKIEEIELDILDLIKNSNKFIKYINEPDSEGLSITRYWIQVWSDRVDLQQKFPLPHSLDQGKYLLWVKTYAEFEDLTLHEDFKIRYQNCSLHKLNDSKFIYIGYLNSINGLGESARLNIQMLKELGLNPGEVSYNRIQGATLNKNCNCKSPYDLKVSNKIIFVHINPDNMENFFNDFTHLNKNNNYLIFIWAWEFENPSFLMKYYANYANEIWGVSNFVKAAIEKISGQIKVEKFNHYLPEQEIDLFNKKGKYILSILDCNSVSERKNIFGTIESYLRSNLPSKGVELWIKTLNLNEHNIDKMKLMKLAQENSTLKLINQSFDNNEMDELYSGAQYFISLHRSEGFGLNILKSHRFGLKTMVTKYSGNLDFCSDINSVFIPYKIIPLTKYYASFFGHQKWADPDLDFASDQLNNLTFDENSKIIIDNFNSNHSFLAGISELNKLIRQVKLRHIKQMAKRSILKSIFTPFIPFLNMPYKIKRQIKIYVMDEK